MFEAADASPRPEMASYSDGLGFRLPRALAWNGAAGAFLALSLEKRLVSMTPDVTSVTDLPIDLSGYLDPRNMDYRPDGNQVAIADRVPPVDPMTGTRIPRVDFYDLATSTLTDSTWLGGLPPTVPMMLSLAYVPGRQEIVSHFQIPNNGPEPIDSVVYTHRLDGSIAGVFDLRPLGISRVVAVNYLPATDELLCTVMDITGQVRLLVTTPTGEPRRSYRIDPIAGLSDLAPITSGPYAGDLGVVFSDPSEYLRVALE
jgi:hypothetical protein